MTSIDDNDNDNDMRTEQKRMNVFDLMAAGGAGFAWTTLAVRVGIARGAKQQRERERPKAQCGCGHDLAMHDPKTNQCHKIDIVEIVEGQDRVTGFDLTHDERVRCDCKQYTGPRPLETWFASDVLMRDQTEE